MSYTSPSPANVALNGNQTTWWIPARNLSTHTATNVVVTVTVSPVGGLAPVTYLAEVGTFNFTTGSWNVGTLAAGAVKWLKIVTSVSDIGLAPFTVTSVITGDGIDPNNVNNTLVQTITSVVTAATAGAVADPNSCFCGDVSLNDTACNYGTTEWRLDELSVTNSTVYTWDDTTGKYHFTPDDVTQNITAQYSIWCDGVEISGPVTLTIPAVVTSVTPFDHTIAEVEYGDLSVDDVAVLTAQYPSLDLTAYCWHTLRNADGELTSGTKVNCNESRARAFYVCTEESCIAGDEDCPCSNDIPAGILAALPEGYLPNEGDIIFVQHPYARSVWRYVADSWVRDSCGCIEEAIPIDTIAVTGTTTKTLTITFDDASTKTASWTDQTADVDTIFYDVSSTCSLDLEINSGTGAEGDPFIITGDVNYPTYNVESFTPVVGAAQTVATVGLFPACEASCAGTPAYAIQYFNAANFDAVTVNATTGVVTYDHFPTQNGVSHIIVTKLCGGKILHTVVLEANINSPSSNLFNTAHTIAYINTLELEVNSTPQKITFDSSYGTSDPFTLTTLDTVLEYDGTVLGYGVYFDCKISGNLTCDSLEEDYELVLYRNGVATSTKIVDTWLKLESFSKNFIISAVNGDEFDLRLSHSGLKQAVDLTTTLSDVVLIMKPLGILL